MSLINEALKKAQKERSGEAPSLSAIPGIGGERATQIAGRNRPPGTSKLLLSLGFGAGSLIAILVGGIIWFRQPVAATKSAAATPPPVPTPASVPTTSANPVASDPIKPFVLPIPAAVPAPVVPVTAAAPAPKPAAPTAVVAAPTPAAPAAPATPAVPGKFNLQGITFIETLRVTGIRASATDSKVLMNDRVYRAGDIVEHALDIKLVEITASSLSFEDANGNRYVRQF